MAACEGMSRRTQPNGRSLVLSPRYEMKEPRVNPWGPSFMGAIPEDLDVALLLCSFCAAFMGRKSKAEEPVVFSRLEEWRVARGLSRQELADAVSVHFQTIGYLERGEYSPSLALVLHIASVLDVPLEELFSLQPFTKSRKEV